MTSDAPRVFLSYSHDSPEHRERVLALADRLRRDGVEAWLDQYEPAPAQGWPRWMEEQIEGADFVLAVCTETYERRFRGKEAPGKGLGVTWEGAILTQTLYDHGTSNATFVPVVFAPEDAKHIPLVLRPVSRYDAGSDKGYEQLLRRLTAQPEVVAPPVGRRRVLPSRPRVSPARRVPPAGRRTTYR